MEFEDNGSMVDPPKLSNRDNFSNWKNRMITFLDSIDVKLMKSIKEGRHIIIPPLIIPPGTPEHSAINARIKWNDENNQKAAIDSKAKQILAVSLPEDIYGFVMYCESAKEMWDNLVVLFEGTDETRECLRSLLIHEYKLFEYNHGESLTQTYIRFNCLINDLNQHNKTFDNEEMLIKFLTSVPPALNTMSTTIRESKNLETMSLQSLYGTLLAHEKLKLKKEKSFKGVKICSSGDEGIGLSKVDSKLIGKSFDLYDAGLHITNLDIS